MKRIRIALLSLLAVLALRGGAAAEDDSHDVPGSKDHPRVSRFKGSVIVDYKASAFGQMELLLSNPGSKQKTQNIEGNMTRLVYRIPKGHDSHEVYRSYESELRRAGFESLYECAGEKECGGFEFPSYMQDKLGFLGNTDVDSERYLAARRHGPDGDTYVMLYAYFQRPDQNRAFLTVVDVAKLSSGSVTVSAENLARDITTEGHAVVYGVYFDSDRATIKPESDAALTEMAKMLAHDASLKVFIVGHTDNAGLPARNTDLSQKRAEAVVNALVVTHHVDRKRLEGRGVGSLAPVSSNKTEDGRAKNRRVELVEK